MKIKYFVYCVNLIQTQLIDSLNAFIKLSYQLHGSQYSPTC